MNLILKRNGIDVEFTKKYDNEENEEFYSESDEEVRSFSLTR